MSPYQAAFLEPLPHLRGLILQSRVSREYVHARYDLSPFLEGFGPIHPPADIVFLQMPFFNTIYFSSVRIIMSRMFRFHHLSLRVKVDYFAIKEILR